MDPPSAPPDSVRDDGSVRDLMPSRREFLEASVLLSAGMAGCGSDSGTTDTETATDESTVTPTATRTPTATATPTPSDPEPLVVEDFAEDSLDYYEGATNEFMIDTDITLSGGYALEDATNDWGEGSMARTKGLEYVPQAGDTFHLGLYVRDYDREGFPFWGAFHWAVDEEEGLLDGPEGFQPRNCYALTFDTRGGHTQNPHGDVIFSTFSTDGQWTKSRDILTVPMERPYPKGEWVDIEIDWGTDGSIDVTVADADENAFASVSIVDDTHQSGGIGFRQGGSRGHINLWDYVRITDR